VPLVFAVLRIEGPKDVESHSRQAEDWETLNGNIDRLCERYASELGENAYAVFNAVTDLASHPPRNRCVTRERHTLQRLAGTWLSAFSRECRQPRFKLADHLAGPTDKASAAAG
jgi:hypothetical protein